MDPRVSLLKEFYRGLPKDQAKLETTEHGFAFLEALLADGITLDYGELTLSGLLHKYKLAHIPERRMDELLHAHVEKRSNVCLYFDDAANDTFCFNLDNNHKVNNTAIIPEMDFAVRALRELLVGVGCEPLIVASGRGYHVWGRLTAAVENARLYQFLLRAAVKTLAQLHAAGHDHQKVKFNLYPDERLRGAVSLRLFGSEHTKNKVFSHVFTPSGLLDEAASWAYFEEHLHRRTLAIAQFDAACIELAQGF
jgi:hypothetical protein